MANELAKPLAEVYTLNSPYNIEDLGFKIREARELSGIAQKQAAIMLGISRQTYRDIEDGKIPPRADILCLIATLYGRSLNWLFQVDIEQDIDSFNDAKKHLIEVKVLLDKIL